MTSNSEIITVNLFGRTKPLIKAIANRLDTETSREIALQALASFELPDEDPWAMTKSNAFLPFRLDSHSTGRPLVIFSGIDASEFISAAEIFATLSEVKETAAAAAHLWPTIRWAASLCGEQSGAMYSSCREMSRALELIPGYLGSAHIQDASGALGKGLECTPYRRLVFEAITAKIHPDESKEGVQILLSEIDRESQVDSLSCLIAGLAAQPRDLEAEQVRSVFVALSRRSFFLGMVEADRRNLKEQWSKVIRRIRSSEAINLLPMLTEFWKQETDPRKEWAILAMPAVAGRVLPQHSREVFDLLVRTSSLRSDPEADEVLAESLTALPGKIPPQDLLDFLKQPQCVGALRSATLARLERETGRKFDGSLWKAVEWARTAGIDLNSPPSAPASR